MKMISSLALVAAASFFSTGCQCNDKSCETGAACEAGKACEGEKAACCAGGKATAASATANSMCVLNPTNAVAEGVMTEYKGTKIGFCCAGCIGKFNAMSDADKAAKLAKVGVTLK